MLIAGNKIYEECSWCKKLVRTNGFFGSLHICLTEEEKHEAECMEMIKNHWNSTTTTCFYCKKPTTDIHITKLGPIRACSDCKKCL